MVVENTPRKIIYNIRESLKETNADSNYSNRKIWSTVYAHAKTLIDRDARDRKLYKNSENFSPLCVMMEEVSSIMCSCIDVQTCKTLYRSVNKLPKLFQTVMGPVIYSAFNIDGSKELYLTTPKSANLKSKDKDNDHIYLFIDEGYLYSIKRIEALRLLVMLEDSEIPEEFNCTSSTNQDKEDECTPWLDRKTFIPDRLLGPVISSALQELLPTKNIMDDTLNNKNPNIETR